MVKSSSWPFSENCDKVPEMRVQVLIPSKQLKHCPKAISSKTALQMVETKSEETNSRMQKICRINKIVLQTNYATWEPKTYLVYI
jgi:hypothetical protein